MAVTDELERLQHEEARLRHAGDIQGALSVLDRMLELDPDFSPALNNKGALLAGTGRWHDALPSLRAACEADPSNAPAAANLGAALHHTGHHEEAIEWLDRAWLRGYEHAAVLYNSARARMALGQLREALVLWGASLAMDSTQDELRSGLQTWARLLQVPTDPDIDRFINSLVTGLERVSDVSVIRAEPPLGMFQVRVVIDGSTVGIDYR